VLDFTSSLYLGFEHASSDLPAWTRLSLGKPAALEEPPGISRLERELAALTGCERALAAPSTLHLFWDLFGVLADRDVGIFLDRGTYPIARWGVERAAALGVRVRTFPRRDLSALRRELNSAGAIRPVIVTDGIAPGEGLAAPVREYADLAGSRGGLLVLDDTQALGIFGASPGPGYPYGKGGGGSLQRFGLRDSAIVVVSSLAKAFGVPMAMLGGSAALVERFRERSQTRVHCSPPSAATVGAACHALDLNRRFGDRLRSRLADRVIYFRRGVEVLGFLASRSLFPVQPLRLPSDVDVGGFHKNLLDRGIETVLHNSDRGNMQCTFVFTAGHRITDIDQALDALVRADPIAIAREKKGMETRWE
jgi:8-amino-7-oxononanoate synthase